MWEQKCLSQLLLTKFSPKFFLQALKWNYGYCVRDDVGIQQDIVWRIHRGCVGVSMTFQEPHKEKTPTKNMETQWVLKGLCNNVL